MGGFINNTGIKPHLDHRLTGGQSAWAEEGNSVAALRFTPAFGRVGPI